MRTTLLGVLLVLAGSAAAAPPEAGLAVTLSEQHLEAGSADEALEVLLPYLELQDGEVAYAIAYASWIAATQDRQADEVDPVLAVQAADHARRAVALGRVDGYNLLYLIHANDVEDPESLALAAQYLKQGADAGDVGSKLNYMHALYHGSPLFAPNREAACPLAMELADNEQVGGIVAHTLGLIMIRGECGRQADPAGGVEMLRVAAEWEIPVAEYDLAQALQHGVGGDPDPVEAMQWFERAADHGHPGADWSLGMAHVTGLGRPRDSSLAVDHFRKAAEGGDANGMTSLAVMYATGDGVPRDPVKAYSLYQQGADAGNPHALRGMAVMHMQGEGVERDLVRARVLYLQAVAEGDPVDHALDGAMRSSMSQEQVAEADRLHEQWKADRKTHP